MSIMPECVAGYTECRISINLVACSIPYLPANFMNAKIATAPALRNKGWE
jgi:hypothetical protein